MPIAVLIVSVLLLKERVFFRHVFGVLLSVVSLSGIIFMEMGVPSQGNALGVAAMVLAVVIHAIMYVVSRKHCGKISVLTYNSLPCLGAAVVLLLASSIIEHPVYSHFSATSLWATAYLGVIAGVMGIMFYFALQKTVSPFQASLVFLIFPVLAIGIEAMMSGHSISTGSLLLMVPLLLGVLLIKLPVRVVMPHLPANVAGSKA